MFGVWKMRRPHRRWGLYRLRPASRQMYLWAARAVIFLISSWWCLSGFFDSLSLGGVSVSTFEINYSAACIPHPEIRGISWFSVPLLSWLSIFCSPFFIQYSLFSIRYSLLVCRLYSSSPNPKLFAAPPATTSDNVLAAHRLTNHRRGERTVSCVKIGKIPAKNQSKTMVPQSKNRNFQKFFNLLSNLKLRESRIANWGPFSHQTRR